MTRTIADVIRSTAPRVLVDRLPAPEYRPPVSLIGLKGLQIGLAVGAMREHMTDEGYQLFFGLEQSGWTVGWDGCDVAEDVLNVLSIRAANTVLVQDKREWEGRTAERRMDPKYAFRNVSALAGRPDVFRGTVLKDAHGDPPYHAQAAAEMGAHFWVVYYHPKIVAHLATYVRPEHLIRTYHSLDPALVPEFSKDGRVGCLLSGALSGAYPLRKSLAVACREGRLPGTTLLPHPGYHQRGCETPKYLQMLAKFRVAICTSSVYGYALRKIMEATACGCTVITDLPEDEVLPEIDGNLIRVPHDAEPRSLLPLLNALVSGWDADRQAVYAERAKRFYDYRAVGRRLAEDIENLRVKYNERT